MIHPRVLVVGDAMLDRYWAGSASKLSAEAPIPVVSEVKVTWFPGGAANVASNLETLGCEVQLVSGVGNIIKNRLMVGDHQLARWDESDRLQGIPTECLPRPEYFKGFDALVIADYCKGSITTELLVKIWERAGKMPVFVDTKRSPVGFPEQSIFFPNAAEFRKYSFDYIELYRKAKVVQTLGADGIVTKYGSHRSFAKAVRCVNGAGDTVIAAYTYAFVQGTLNPLAFANSAAAVVVGKPYTAVAGVDEVMEVYKRYVDELAAAA